MTDKRRKKTAQPKRIPSKRSGTIVLGRVNTDFAGFLWGLSDYEVKSAAESISKHIEMNYQLELLRSSGFGQNQDD